MPRYRTRVERICEDCGRTFSASKSDVERRGARYCSIACFRSIRSCFARHISTPTSTGCILWLGTKNELGYGHLDRRPPNGKRHVIKAHRVAWELTHGPIPDGLEVCHNCPGGDNPSCVNVAHLFLGTHAENMRDAGLKGQMPRGEANHQSKLTEADVVVILTRHAAGATCSEIAKDFPVDQETIREIIKRKTWRHVSI